MTYKVKNPAMKKIVKWPGRRGIRGTTTNYQIYVGRANDQSLQHANRRAERWTPEDEEYLWDHWPEGPAMEVARKLGRTLVGCGNRYKALKKRGGPHGEGHRDA